MRNLRSVRYDACKAAADGVAITAACWDAAKDEVLLTLGPTSGDPQIRLARVVEGPSSSQPAKKLQLREVAVWDALSPNPDLLVDRVVSLHHHFGDSLATCVVLAGGDIVIVREEGDGAGLGDGGVHIEIVGSIDAGIAAARWAPDEELLAVVTPADTLVLMSRGFEGAVAEATMAPGDLEASRHVSVGWGKKETQFRGKGAKAAALRDPTIPDKVDEGAPSPYDDPAHAAISWRGDGAYVAVNAVVGISRRAIRIYSREGVLEGVSEPVDGLEAALSWRPAGNLIAGIQRLAGGRVDVVFFERNGLRHGQFTLRPPSVDGGVPERADKQIGLEWNSDSTVLAIRHANAIQLWTMGNYHWYLKQEIYTGPGCSLVSWHPEKPLRLAVAASDTLLSSEYIFTVARGSLGPPHDYGAVAVVDGNTVKVTPFRTANVPPPMSLLEVTTTAEASSVIDVAFAPDNSAMAVLHTKGVDIYSWQTKGPRSLAPILAGKLEFGIPDSGLHEEPVFQVCFSGKSTLCVLHRSGAGLLATTYTFDASTRQVAFADSKEVSPGTIMVTSTNGQGNLYLQDRSGMVSQLAPQATYGGLSVKFPAYLPWFEVIEVIETGEGGEGPLAIGLSRGGQLYANARLLVKNCTSFLITPDHIVLTTSNHLLKFIHFGGGVDDLEVPADDPETDERCRSIERGARLVTAMPTSMSVVLQMPRGNLETVYPRAMVVAGIRKLVDEKEYGQAFAHCRTQRVDMNILYDHRPEQFLSNVGLFLDQLKDVSYIDLFLSSLREEDVTHTMYKDTKSSSTTRTHQLFPHLINNNLPTPPPPTGPSQSKVNTICDAVLKSLQARKGAHLQNIITAHVCKVPPALDDGLRVVAGLMREKDDGGEGALAERAVEHICFLVDVNRLFDHALGLYDLDLALLVAQRSQRDPREYLPFVQALHAARPEARRRFAIDDHLGRREKALTHLQALGTPEAFAELRDYVVRHGLYQAALGLYRYDEERRRDLTALYAEHLEAGSKFREAGLAYESLGNYARAASCYQSAGASCWRECLFAAQQQQLEQQQGDDGSQPTAAALTDLASTLADALVEAKDFAAAATIHLDYLSAPEAAIRCLCRGYLFADAMLVAAQRQRPDLLATAVDPGLAEAMASSTELLADCRAQLRAQVPRILELRRKAAEDPLGFYEGATGSGDVPDDVSVAASSRLSTSASLFTRYTAGSGTTGTGTAATAATARAAQRSRRREEKKRARGRKGTVYEAEYLVNSVRRLVARVAEVRAGELGRLVAGLVRRGMHERARAVEALLADLVEECRVAVAEVWPKPVTGTAPPPGSTGGGGVLLQNGVEGEGAEAAPEPPPVVAAFTRLSLLG